MHPAYNDGPTTCIYRHEVETGVDWLIWPASFCDILVINQRRREEKMYLPLLNFIRLDNLLITEIRNISVTEFIAS